MHEGIVEKIRSAGGEIYAITSEPQHLADQAREHWELEFESVGDPHQEIARVCSERGWLTLYTHDQLEFIQRGADWKLEHPKGFFQPGVLALTSAGRVLYRWRSVPSSENLNGTLCRPTASHAWKHLERALEAGPDVGDAAHDENPEIDQARFPLPIFFALLLANGWFLKVRSFAYAPGVGAIPKRIGVAALRLVLFVAAWVAAFAWLPALPVLVVLVAWLAWVLRDAQQLYGKAQTHKKVTA